MKCLSRKPANMCCSLRSRGLLVSVCIAVLAICGRDIVAESTDPAEDHTLELPSTDTSGQHTVIDRVEAAWNRRLQQLKSCRVQWTSECFYSRKFISQIIEANQSPSPPLPKMEENRVDGSEMSRCAQSFSMLMSGDKVRLEHNGERIKGFDSPLERFGEISVTDGVVSKNLRHPTKNRPYPYGTVYSQAINDTVMDVATLPIRAFFLPFSSSSGIPNLSEFVFNNDDGSTDGSRLNLIYSAADSSRRLSLELDRPLGFSITRMLRTTAGGDPMSDLQIDYQQDTLTGEWLPASWSYISYRRNGDVFYKLDSTVTSVEVDVQCAVDDFEIEFLPGTLVSDYRSSEPGYDQRFGEAFYLIKSGGERRIIRASERNLGYNHFLTTDPAIDPVAVRATTRTTSMMVLFIVNALILVGVGMLFMRSRLRRQR